MIYNLSGALPLNFDYKEARSCASKNCADIIVLTYLHLHYLEEIPKLNTMVKRLNLSTYPSINLSDFTSVELKTKKLKSTFYFEQPTTRLTYTQILYDDLDDYDKVIYLKLVDNIPPYSGSKFVHEEFVSSIPTSLVMRGLIKKVDQGYVLLKERV